MTTGLIEELKWRGMLQDATPNFLENFDSQAGGGYVGFDPTAKSLHIGNLAAIMMLKHLQLSGHKPIVLLGGFTGMIGDPSGKSAERNFLSVDELQENTEMLRQQFVKFLDFECGPSSAEIVNNHDWLSEISVSTFFRDIGKYVSVNQMMKKDSVKKRLESESGISFTEFSYQLFQAYDFFWLYQHKNCRLQMGGSDQWGNIMSGVEFIRRKLGQHAFAATCPLLLKPDGVKFGKTEEGNVWLDAQLTNPYKFYQFWLNVEDQMITKLLKSFTLFGLQEIERLERECADDPNRLKRILAEDVTRRVHSEEQCARVVRASELLFGRSTIRDFEESDDTVLGYLFADLPQTTVNRVDLKMKSIVDLIAAALALSKAEVRRLIKAGGISVNKEKVSNETTPESLTLLKNRYLLIQRGKVYGLVGVID